MPTLVPILLYHSIAEHVDPRFRTYAVRPEAFAAQMDYLARNGYTPIPVGEYASVITGGEELPRKPVVITFDDGLEDFVTSALPTLQEHGFPATLYVVTGYVGQVSRWLAPEGEGNRPMLNWTQIASLCHAGIECGAHTVHHPQLDVIPVASAREEIVRSRQMLEQHLGSPVLTFAYPNGHHSPRVRGLVIEVGYTSACAVKDAMSATDDDPFALSRIYVREDVDVERFGRLLEGEGLWVTPSSEWVGTKALRLWRRLNALVRTRS